MTPWILVGIALASGDPGQLEVTFSGPYDDHKCVEQKQVSEAQDLKYHEYIRKLNAKNANSQIPIPEAPLPEIRKMGCSQLNELGSYVVRVYTTPPPMTPWILISENSNPDEVNVITRGPYRRERECTRVAEVEEPYLKGKMGCMPLSELPSYIVRVFTPLPLPGGAK
jgi:hypothetical protein